MTAVAAIVLAVLAVASSVTAYAYYVIKLKKQYTDITLDDVYSFGTGNPYYAAVSGGANVSVNAKYGYDVIVTGGDIEGATPVLTAGDTGVYELSAGTAEFTVSGGNVKLALVKHSVNNVYLSSAEQLGDYAAFNAVLRNGVL